MTTPRPGLPPELRQLLSPLDSKEKTKCSPHPTGEEGLMGAPQAHSVPATVLQSNIALSQENHTQIKDNSLTLLDRP